MMTNEKLAELQKQGQEFIEQAKALVEKHGEDLSTWPPSVRAKYDEHTDAAGEILKAIRVAKDDLAIIAKAREIGQAIGCGLDGPGGTPKGSNRLSFKGMAGALARSIQPDGVKALAPSGAAVVGQEFTADPVALGKPALSLLDVIPVVTHSAPEISYLRQTTRTNNAAVVAAGALKPTSVYTVTRIENSLQMIAHLSEGIPRHWLLDNSSLEQFLAGELEFGLQTAVEAKVLTDVNAASGIQTQTYATSVLATLRKGITKLEQAGYTASAFVLTPADWEGVELALSSTTAIEHLSLP